MACAIFKSKIEIATGWKSGKIDAFYLMFLRNEIQTLLIAYQNAPTWTTWFIDFKKNVYFRRNLVFLTDIMFIITVNYNRTTTFLQRPPTVGPVYNIKRPSDNQQQSTNATILVCRGCQVVILILNCSFKNEFLKWNLRNRGHVKCTFPISTCDGVVKRIRSCWLSISDPN